MDRSLALVVALVLFANAAMADEPSPNLSASEAAAAIESHFQQLSAFEAVIHGTIQSPDGKDVVLTAVPVAGNRTQFQFKLSGARGTDTYFRDGAIWYRHLPEFESYYICRRNSIAGLAAFDPRDAGSPGLHEPLMERLATDPKPKREERDDGDVLWRMQGPSRLPVEGWSVQLSKTLHYLPIRSELTFEGRKIMQVDVAYRQIMEGVYFPKQVTYTYFDDKGKWKQRLIHTIELKSYGDTSPAMVLVPPAVPPGTRVTRLLDE